VEYFLAAIQGFHAYFADKSLYTARATLLICSFRNNPMKRLMEIQMERTAASAT
jgi:hypothetical protein